MSHTLRKYLDFGFLGLEIPTKLKFS